MLAFGSGTCLVIVHALRGHNLLFVADYKKDLLMEIK